MIMIFILIGIIICIAGLAFPNPGLFVFIGILLPLIVFIFFAFCPTESVEKKKDTSEFGGWKDESKTMHAEGSLFFYACV